MGKTRKAKVNECECCTFFVQCTEYETDAESVWLCQICESPHVVAMYKHRIPAYEIALKIIGANNFAINHILARALALERRLSKIEDFINREWPSAFL